MFLGKTIKQFLEMGEITTNRHIIKYCDLADFIKTSLRLARQNDMYIKEDRGIYIHIAL
jgi:hypothetical protein